MRTNEEPTGAHGDHRKGEEHDAVVDYGADDHGRVFDPPHTATEFDAGDGQGTVSGPPLDGGVLRRPILDGATQSPEAEATVPNPYRGVDDPGAIGKQPALNDATPKRWLLAGVVATVIVAIPLVVLAPYAPLWAGIGMIAALFGLLLMLVVLWMSLERRRELRAMALLLAWIWIVPAAMIVTILVSQADRIFA